MLTKDFYAKADAAAIGAAQRTVSLTSLRNMEICVPDKIRQSKIVDTLAAYDDLIEKPAFFMSKFLFYTIAFYCNV